MKLLALLLLPTLILLSDLDQYDRGPEEMILNQPAEHNVLKNPWHKQLD